MPSPTIIEADWTWTGQRFEPGVQIVIDPDGRIKETGPLGHTATQRFSNRALVPGLINAHSHAFQRGLRGRTERFAATGAKTAGTRTQATFWNWRDTMYELVEALDETRLHDLSVQAFTEMRDAGITTVGEFHYVHHAGPDEDYAMDRVVLEAARAAGIRLVLLEAYYRAGGIGQTLENPQARFRTTSLESYWHNIDQVNGDLDPAREQLGVVAHSVRAVPLEEIVELHSEASNRSMVFHMHVEEQPEEIGAALEAYGHRPLALLTERLGNLGNMTAVHGTHSTPEDLDRFLDRGGRLCVCPLTEANLGDGIPILDGVDANRLCLGTDSNARISLIEEARWLEYGQRLRRQIRGAVVSPRGYTAEALLSCATVGGARALGVDAGRIAAGAWADFCLLDLEAPALAGWEPDTLLDALIVGGGNAVVRATAVGGRWRKTGEGAGGA